jgi:hypothetical protein
MSFVGTALNGCAPVEVLAGALHPLINTMSNARLRIGNKLL